MAADALDDTMTIDVSPRRCAVSCFFCRLEVKSMFIVEVRRRGTAHDFLLINFDMGCRSGSTGGDVDEPFMVSPLLGL